MDMARELSTAQAELLGRLRTHVADRPAHKNYLEALLLAAEPLDVPVPTGVSLRVADALIDDVHWITQLATQPGNGSQYPAAYEMRRETDSQRARSRTRKRGPSTPALSPLVRQGPIAPLI